MRVALLADLHVGTWSTSTARLARVVAQVNAARPDLVLIAGDLLPGHTPIDPAVAQRSLAPLAGLRARLGVVAVPGNHDHWTMPGGLGAVLPRGVTLLANDAVRRGPLAIAGVDDGYTHHGRPGATLAKVRALAGARIVLEHDPDLAPALPRDMPLLLAGHTHCGQVVLPGHGPVEPVIRHLRYGCGAVRDPGRLTVVTAGIGTSVAPFRLFAPADWWLLTLGPDVRSLTARGG